MLIGHHRVPPTAFDLLAHGYADAAAMDVLRAARLSKQTLQIRAVVDAARGFRRAASAVPIDEAVELIDEAQRRSPAAAAEVLGYPLVGAWAAQALRRLRRQAPADTPLWVDLAHLGAVAAAAGIRAGIPVRLPVAVRAGVAHLPTLGSARLAGDAGWAVATVHGRAGGYAIEGQHTAVAVPADPAQPARGWTAIPRLTFTGRSRILTAYLDDTDPYRNHGLATAAELDGRERAAWQSCVARAWAIVEQYHPERAAELAARPITVVPLAERPGAPRMSGTNRDSVGAMALTLPPDPFDLALSMVHEFQHSKLGALLDLVDLYDAGERRRFYSPWRADPRPLGGLLQGAYAFLGVARCWGRHTGRETGVVSSRLAEYEFARMRGQVAAAVRELAGSGALTEPGTRFVAGLRAAADALADQPVSAEAARLARLVRDDHRVSWRLRNLEVDPGSVTSLAAAWRRSDPRPSSTPPPALAAKPALRIATQPRHDEIRRGFDSPPVTEPTPDATLAAGDDVAAAHRYLAGLRAEPQRLDLWAGLAVARQRTGPPDLARVYATEPELVFALHARLAAEGAVVDPDVLAGWLAG